MADLPHDNNHPKFYPYPEWENSERFLFLGSERNPHTGMCYDYWLHEPDGDPRYCSPTARNGLEPHEYGSGPLCTAYYDTSHFGEDAKKDYVWGMKRVQLLALYWLATGERPGLQDENYILAYTPRGE